MLNMKPYITLQEANGLRDSVFSKLLMATQSAELAAAGLSSLGPLVLVTGEQWRSFGPQPRKPWYEVAEGLPFWRNSNKKIARGRGEPGTFCGTGPLGCKQLQGRLHVENLWQGGVSSLRKRPRKSCHLEVGFSLSAYSGSASQWP